MNRFDSVAPVLPTRDVLAALHAEWATADVEGRLHAPTDTDYGLREGAYVDPDGNLLRYGSPLP